MSTALVPVAKCAVCGQLVRGAASRRYTGQVKISLHTHHRLAAWCAGSGSVMPRWKL